VDAPAAQDFAKPFVEIAIAAARLECETQGGAFDPEIEKVVWELPDLNGYDRADLALDRSGFLCDGANAIYGDAQGWQLSVLVSGDEGGGHFRFQALDWRIVEWSGDSGDAATLVLKVPGMACGGSNADPCFQALAWRGTELLTTLGFR
jgi:hypothetical protein